MAAEADNRHGKRSKMVQIAENMIGSSKNLWILISGASALTSKELVGTDLQKNLQKISKGLNFYLPQSSNSAKKLQADPKIDDKLQSVILQLSKFMNLDEIQCYKLFCDYLLYDYRGSETSLQVAVSSERFMQNLMLQIWDYYRCDRLYLLLSIKEILAHYDDECHPYHDLFDEFLSLIDQNDEVRTSLLSQWDLLMKVVIPSSKQPSYLVDTQSKTLLWFTLREQCELLQALLIYFKGKKPDAKMFLSLLKSFKERGFGWQQAYRLDVNPSSLEILKTISQLECLILLQTLNLQTLQADDNRPSGYFLYRDKTIWKEIDAIICRLGSHREPAGMLVSVLCLAWAVIRFYVLGEDSSSNAITRCLGDAGLQFGAFDFLHSITLNPVFQGDGPTARCAHATIYSLLSALLTKFDDSSLGDTRSLYKVAGELVKDPKVAEMFWEEGLESSLGMLLSTAMSTFPHRFCTLVDYLTGLAQSSPSSASKVYHCFRQLTNLMFSLLPEMDVEEMHNDEHVLQLRQDFITDTICLRAGTIGYCIPNKSRSSYDVVQWQQEVNGWEISLRMMTAITGLEQISRSQIQNVASLTRLLRHIIFMEPDTYLDLYPLVDQLFLVVQRFAKLPNPPADVISSALDLASSVRGEQRLLRMWQRLVQVGFLPMNSDVPSTYLGNIEFSLGTINSIISSCECVTGEYSVTLAFLNLVSTFVPIMIDRDDLHFSACVAFIVREIFPSHSRFWYRTSQQKEEMAEKCLNVFHLILKLPSSDKRATSKGNIKSTLQSVVLQCLLHQEAGHALLQIICRLESRPTRQESGEGASSGDDTVHCSIQQQIGWGSGHRLQPFKLALSVLNRLLILWSCDMPEQNSTLITTLCSNPHAIRTVANYIYQSDMRLATLAVLLMKRFAMALPISLLVCLGPDAATFCKLLLFRLEARAEDIHLKAAILTFMSACVKSQPGTTEVFIGDVQNESGTGEKHTSGKCKSNCLRLVVDILKRTSEGPSLLNELRAAALLFLKALWVGRQAVALNDLRNCSSIWNILLEPLLDAGGFTSHLQSSALTLAILAQEFLLKPTKKDNNPQLMDLVQKMTGPILLEWTKSVYDKCAVQSSAVQAEASFLADNVSDTAEELLKAWNDFLTVGLKTGLITLPSAQKMSIVNITIDALNDELGREDKKAQVCILSETLVHLLRHCANLDLSEIMDSISRLLTSVLTAGAEIPTKVRANIVAACILVIPDNCENTVDSQVASSWMGMMCDVIHQSVLLADKAISNQGSGMANKIQMVVLCTSLLQKFSWVCSDTKLLLVHLHRSSVIHTLLRFTLTCIRRDVPDGCHEVLQLFCCLSNFPDVAGSILQAEVVQALCLPLTELKLFQMGNDTEESEKWLKVYRSSIHLLTCLLHNLRHFVVEQSFLDFVKVHLFIFETIPTQLQRNLCPETLEMALSVLHLIEELSHFQSLQLHCVSPCRELLKITSSVLYVSVATLLRPRLILHSMGVQELDGEKEVSTPRKISTTDFEQRNPKLTEATNQLLRLASLCTSILCNFSPDLVELLSSKGHDTEQWEQLLDIGFGTPSLDQIMDASFGTVISGVTVCLRLLCLNDHTVSPVQTPSSHEPSFPNRKLVTTFLEKSLYLILSQAINLNAHQPSWDKQLFRRELGAELGPFVQSRYLRRGPSTSSPMCSPAASPGQTRIRVPSERSPFLNLVSALVENLFK